MGGMMAKFTRNQRFGRMVLAAADIIDGVVVLLSFGYVDPGLSVRATIWMLTK